LLLIKYLEQAVSRRATRTTFGGKELQEYGDSSSVVVGGCAEHRARGYSEDSGEKPEARHDFLSVLNDAAALRVGGVFTVQFVSPIFKSYAARCE
jgi:hypothetical protein